MEELDLTIGEGYEIKLFPKKKVVKATYVGRTKREYVFEEGDNLVIVNQDHARRDNEIITHCPISSFNISNFPKSEVFEHPERDSELTKILEGLKKSN